MKCKNLKYRTKTDKKTKRKIIYKYCKVLRKKINGDECYGRNCAYKEYKKEKCTINRKNCTKKSTLNKKSPLIGGHKHKLTKATEIPMKVKKVVWERDNHRCIYCNKYVDVYYANSHFIKRGQLGKGIEENVVTACQNCHHLYDFGTNSEEMINYTREYLKSKYSDWNEEKLVYKKS